MSSHMSAAAVAEQRDRARRFHDLHHGGEVLVLLNAWDAGSARIFESAGAAAIGSTSAGVAYAAGRPDGGLARDRMVEGIGRICAAVDLPVSADIESGFGTTPEEVRETVAAGIAAGAVGVNIEDAADGEEPALRPIEEQCERLRAARTAADAAGVELFINGRTDVFWAGLEGERRLDTAIERLNAYVEAGSDGVFVPRLVEAAEIGRVAESIDAPLNVLVAPGMPRVEELKRLGVRRLSTGSGPSRAALAATRRLATDLLEDGRYDLMVDSGLSYAEANELLG